MMKALAILLALVAMAVSGVTGYGLGTQLGWIATPISLFMGFGIGWAISPLFFYLWDWEPDDRPLRD